MKAVFDINPTSSYDDSHQRYHFPNRYIKRVKETQGDWVLIRETGKNGGRMAYVAMARVVDVVRDMEQQDRWYANLIEYLPFNPVVPLKVQGKYYESRFNESTTGKINVQGQAVRLLSNREFMTIANYGLRESISSEDRAELVNSDTVESGNPLQLDEELLRLPERKTVELFLKRPVRELNFRRHVLTAYNNTCAFTGISIINGGGKAEVQAAHIQAVHADGPDVVQNGIALTATCHWLFDRYLVTLRDDYSLMIAHNKIPENFQDLLRDQLPRIRLPEDPRLQPHPRYMAWHREQFANV